VHGGVELHARDAEQRLDALADHMANIVSVAADHAGDLLLVDADDGLHAVQADGTSRLITPVQYFGAAW
jgi:hypothetical protein